MSLIRWWCIYAWNLMWMSENLNPSWNPFIFCSRNFVRFSFCSCFKNIFQEYFLLIFSWNSSRRFFRIPTSIFPRFDEFFPGLFLENISRFLNSDRLSWRFAWGSTDFFFRVFPGVVPKIPHRIFPGVLPAFCLKKFSFEFFLDLSQDIHKSFPLDIS